MTEKTETKLPTMWDVLLSDMPKFSIWVGQQITNFFEWIFSTTAAAGARRLWLLTWVFGIWWARTALRVTPIVLSGNSFKDLILYPLDSLFVPQIMRHVVLIAMMFWLTLRLAARYLDDVFELNDIVVAEKYLMQAVFGSEYDTINIRDGDVAQEHTNSPIVRVGGPGMVKVHFDNAVLFEQADGSPRVYGPNDTITLDRFERLRSVIDLREQVADMTVRERTKDGIHITAQGSQMIYSISRGSREPTLEQPHPFDADAISKIVYSQSNAKRFTSRQDKTSPSTQVNTKNPTIAMPGFIQGQLKKFINQNSLSEFLTSTQRPEFEAKKREEERLEEETQKITKTTPIYEVKENDQENNQKEEEPAPTEPTFHTRDKITQQFYEEVDESAQKKGMELHWIDIGTWVLSENTKNIQEQHLDAWNLSIENTKKDTEGAFEKSHMGAKNDQLQRLYKEVPLATYFQYNRLKNEKPDFVIRKLLQAYWDQFRPAWKSYEDLDDKAPEDIEYIAKYLRSLLLRYPDEKQKKKPNVD